MSPHKDDRSSYDDPIKSIPEPGVVRAKLDANLRERRILKQLLKLSESAALPKTKRELVAT